MSLVWDEAVGEYNSRPMVNEYVLRGGSCAIPQERIRASFAISFPRNMLANSPVLRIQAVRDAPGGVNGE
jgi:hypothetical protein